MIYGVDGVGEMDAVVVCHLLCMMITCCVVVSGTDGRGEETRSTSGYACV